MALTASGCVRAAKDAMAPGVEVSQINKICEGFIKNSPYAKFLLHSSGHSIGLSVVEYIRQSMMKRKKSLCRE